MKRVPKLAIAFVIAGAFLQPLSVPAPAGETPFPSVDPAIRAGNFCGYQADATAWLNAKSPVQPDETALAGLLNDPAILAVLDQRQLIAKIGAAKLDAFAQADPGNREFLAWLLGNTPAMDLYLEGAVPIGLAAREENQYALDLAALDIWKRILKADPDARDGLCLKLAIATALFPPGSVNIGAGGAAVPEDPVVRYTYYKTAWKNKELFPSFDHLTVWEYGRIVCSGASNADLTWAREMINTFRPDLRADEMVVNSTSLVWRRAAPEPFWRKDVGYDGSFKNVLAGGGKCGPRSSWSVMVCHAFGIPAIGVGQPAHACVAYKAANPMTQPQPGSVWKVGYGAGWEKSRLLGLSGPDFLAGIEQRSDAAKFSRVEHLRWLASALTPADRAAAVMSIARAVQESTAPAKTDLTASLKPEEAEADPGGVDKSRFRKSVPSNDHSSTPSARTTPADGPESPAKANAGVIHVEAASFVKTGGEISWGGQTPRVLVHECHTGGKQVYFQQQMKEQWADYAIDVPASDVYELKMKAACINIDQALEVCCGGKVIATVPIPLSYGLWRETTPVELQLEKGSQTIRIQTPVSVAAEKHERGIALRWFELKARQ